MKASKIFIKTKTIFTKLTAQTVDSALVTEIEMNKNKRCRRAPFWIFEKRPPVPYLL